MKPKIIRQADVIKVSTESQTVEVWDSAAFDTIKPQTLQTAFTDSYNKHLAFLIKLVTSRTALNTAMVNIDESVKEHMNGSTLVHETATVAAIDKAFELALKTYAYEDAFSFLDETTRKEILVGLLTNKQPVSAPLGGGSKKAGPIGVLGNKTVDDITKGIEDIARRLNHKLGDAPSSPYGEMDEDRRPSRKVGAIRNKPVRGVKP